MEMCARPRFLLQRMSEKKSLLYFWISEKISFWRIKLNRSFICWDVDYCVEQEEQFTFLKAWILLQFKKNQHLRSTFCISKICKNKKCHNHNVWLLLSLTLPYKECFLLGMTQQKTKTELSNFSNTGLHISFVHLAIWLNKMYFKFKQLNHPWKIKNCSNIFLYLYLIFCLFVFGWEAKISLMDA